MMTTLHIRKESEIHLFDREFETDLNWINAKNKATGSYKDKLLRYEREHRTHLSRIKQNKQGRPVQSATTQKQVVQPQQISTKTKKESSDSEFFCSLFGLLLLLATVIFGFYAWFAHTGLSLLMYYLIMVGSSCVGALLLTVGYGLKEKIESLTFCGIGVPVVVTIIRLLVDLVIWVIKLF